MAKWLTVSIGVAALAISTAANAQALSGASHPFANERRVSVGVSIPLGGRSDEASTPQLEFRTSAAGEAGARHRAIHGDGLIAQRNRDSRIGLTLEANPKLTLAGRELPGSEDKLGISTLGLVAIGVAAAAVVGGLLFIDAVNDASD